MKKSLKISLALMLFSLTVFTACNMMDSEPINSTVENFLTIIPADNTQNIGINDPVVIQFAAPLDINIVESNFALISQKDIADSTCPVNKNIGHSDMMKDMTDSSMMNHLQMAHQTKGTFKWNSDRTRCEFKPDSALKPNTDYMMYIDTDMMKHMKNMMTANGMMGNRMGMMDCDCTNKGLDKAYIVTRFKTKGN